MRVVAPFEGDAASPHDRSATSVSRIVKEAEVILAKKLLPVSVRSD
jgi:hypothetical protein